jgi:negative regulator of flagellin synthesis FlgM
MAIDHINLTGNSGVDQWNIAKTQSKDSRSSGSSGSRSGVEDALSISSQAMEIARLASQTEQMEDAGADRIEQIRQAIAAGTYNVSGEDIARKMIEAHKK